jgi:hypothetical protein
MKQWVITSLDTKPQEGNLMDVVVTVNWRRIDTEIVDDKEYYTDVYGSMPCATPSETDFTAYPDLTYEQVCGWLDAGLDVSQIDEILDFQLNNLINPPIVVLPLPFNNPTI